MRAQQGYSKLTSKNIEINQKSRYCGCFALVACQKKQQSNIIQNKYESYALSNILFTKTMYYIHKKPTYLYRNIFKKFLTSKYQKLTK